MANAWTELSRPGCRTTGRSLIAAVSFSLLALGCSAPSDIDRSAEASIVKAANERPLDGQTFEGRIGRFNTAGNKLAVIEGQNLVLTSLKDGERSVAAIDHDVDDLAYSDDGGLWLVGDAGISYWRDGEQQCSARNAGDSPSLLEIDDDRVAVVIQTYLDGKGAVGEKVIVERDCSIERGPSQQAIETALTSAGDGRQLVARAATVDAGPKRRLGPVIEYRTTDGLLKTLSLFENQADIAEISAIASGKDRVLALGTGTDATRWELWTIDDPRLVTAGTLAIPSNRLLPLATSDHVIVGQSLIDLTSGQGQTLIGSGVVEDVTDDQTWWLIDEGNRLSLRSAEKLRES